MRVSGWAAALLLFGSCLVVPAGAGTFLLAPSADTTIEPYGSEDVAEGADPLLRIDQWRGRQALLRFPIASLPGGRRVLRATLRLFIRDVGLNEQGEFADLPTCVGLFDVVTPWTEAGATFNRYDGARPWRQGPGIGGGRYDDVGPLPAPDIGVRLSKPVIPLDPRRAVAGSWLAIDVTEHLRERIRMGGRDVDLLLRTSVLGRDFSFASREAPEAGLRPRLAVETGDAPDLLLRGAFTTEWKPGRRMTVRFASAAGASGASLRETGASGRLTLLRETGGRGTAGRPSPGDRWRFTRRPGGSRLADSALRPVPVGAAFVPDVPGLYRVRLDRAVRGFGVTTETAEMWALSTSSHPRLYVTPDRLRLLRRQVRSGTRLVTAFLRWTDAGIEGAARGEFHDMGMQEGCESAALACLLTGDARYGRASIAYAKRILEKPMREHHADTHGATFAGAAWAHAMALHYDWCFHLLTPAHRKAVAAWLKEAASWSWVRSEKPVGHNDGGGRQILLAAAPLALLGDDPEAPAYLRRCWRNFDENLLPWLNDGGRGGRSGDGGEYEGLHAFFLVRHAWLARSATGEDLFSASPFFRNRLRHIMFGWVPRRLVERNGAYSIRQYYSPAGDHIRLGYVGDTQPYQSAAALCDRYRDTAEAKAVRWLAGEWPTQWMQYCLKWAVLGDFDGVAARPPSSLAYLDPGFATLYTRSDWSDDATWVLLEGGPIVSMHQSLYAGGFEIFKGDLLAARTGSLDHANVGAPHTMNYLHRTVAANGLLIDDPAEKWKGFLGGAEGIHDGGGQRTNFPLSSPDADIYRIYRPVFQRGTIDRFAATPEATYAYADISDAYNNPRFHGGGVNRPKVTRVVRQLLYLRPFDSVVVHDRVIAVDPSFRKTWLLHSLGDLDVRDGRETRIDDGEVRYDGATAAVIRHGWSKPVPSFARCLSVTLLPRNARVTKIGGRIDLPDGSVEGFPGDVWHGEHRHRHVKDFWVRDANYPPGNPPETRWFGEPGSAWHVPGTPDETGGRGKWRIEVSPPTPAKEDVFFHVLCPRLGRDGPFPSVKPVTANGFDGASIVERGRSAAVFFAKEGKRPGERPASFATKLPAGKGWRVIVAGMAPGRYRIDSTGGSPASAPVGPDGLLSFDAAGLVRATPNLFGTTATRRTRRTP